MWQVWIHCTNSKSWATSIFKLNVDPCIPDQHFSCFQMCLIKNVNRWNGARTCVHLIAGPMFYPLICTYINNFSLWILQILKMTKLKKTLCFVTHHKVSQLTVNSTQRLECFCSKFHAKIVSAKSTCTITHTPHTMDWQKFLIFFSTRYVEVMPNGYWNINVVFFL